MKAICVPLSLFTVQTRESSHTRPTTFIICRLAVEALRQASGFVKAIDLIRSLYVGLTSRLNHFLANIPDPKTISLTSVALSYLHIISYSHVYRIRLIFLLNPILCFFSSNFEASKYFSYNLLAVPLSTT